MDNHRKSECGQVYQLAKENQANVDRIWNMSEGYHALLRVQDSLTNEANAANRSAEVAVKVVEDTTSAATSEIANLRHVLHITQVKAVHDENIMMDRSNRELEAVE